MTRADYKPEKEAVFSKGQACFRASPLLKKHGFGIYTNADGKVAIYGESKEYEAFLQD